MFLILIIGFLQVQSMAELSIRISDKDVPQLLLRKVRIVHRVSGLINSLSAGLMIFLTIWFMFVLHVLYSGCNKISSMDIQCCGASKFFDFMAVLGWISGILYTILTVSLVLSYFQL